MARGVAQPSDLPHRDRGNSRPICSRWASSLSASESRDSLVCARRCLRPVTPGRARRARARACRRAATRRRATASSTRRRSSSRTRAPAAPSSSGSRSEYPHDPIVPWAELYAGIASTSKRASSPTADAAARPRDRSAQKTNEGVDTVKAQLYLGIAKNYEGDAAARSRTLLLAGADRAIENDDERAEYPRRARVFARGAARSTCWRSPRCRSFDQLWPRSSPTERAVALAKIAGDRRSGAATDGVLRSLRRLARPRAARAGRSPAAASALIADVRRGRCGAAPRSCRTDIAPATRGRRADDRGHRGRPPARSPSTRRGRRRSEPARRGRAARQQAREPARRSRGRRPGLACGRGGRHRRRRDRDAGAARSIKDRSCGGRRRCSPAQNVIAIVGPIEGVVGRRRDRRYAPTGSACR